MSNEQSIRDADLQAIADRIYTRDEEWAWALGRSRLVPMMTEAMQDLLASPVIRRIQAEALREAADSNDLVALGVAAESSDFGRGVDFGADEIFDALRSRADRIERGEGQ